MKQSTRMSLYLFIQRFEKSISYTGEKEVATTILSDWNAEFSNPRLKLRWTRGSKKVLFSDVEVLETGHRPRPVFEWRDAYDRAILLEYEKFRLHLTKVCFSQGSIDAAYQGAPLLPTDKKWISKFKETLCGGIDVRVRPLMDGYFIIDELELRRLVALMDRLQNGYAGVIS